MRQNVVTPDLAARFNFMTLRHRPMKQRVKSGDPHAARRRLDVFQESRKAPDDFSRSQFFRHAIEFFRGDAGFIGTRNPRRGFDLFRSEFALKCQEHIPFASVRLTICTGTIFAGCSALLPGSIVFRRTCPTPRVKIPFAGIMRKRSAPTFFASNSQWASNENPWGTFTVVQSL